MTALARLALRLALLLSLAAGAALAQDAAQMSKLALMRRLANDIYAGADLSLLRSHFAPDFLWRRAGDAPVSLDAWRAEVEALSDALPDLNTSIVHLLSGGDWAAMLIEFDGTFESPFVWDGTTRPPTDARVRWTQLDLVRFEGGRPVMGYSERDTAALLGQLSAPPDVATSPQQARPAGSAVAAGQAAPVAAAAPVSAAFSRADERRFEQALALLASDGLQNLDPALFDTLLADDFLLHSSTDEMDRAALVTWLESLRGAVPDMVVAAPALLVDGDLGVVRLTMSGTFFGVWEAGDTEPLIGRGQSVLLTSNLLVRFSADGQMTEGWWLYDPADWLAQFNAALPDEATETVP